MAERNNLWSPARYFVALLAIIFLGETAVMSLLPPELPELIGALWTAICDAALLTLVSAPLLWLLLIRPLRAIANDESRKYTAIIQGSRDGIVTLDRNGSILSANATVSSILAIPSDNIIGMNIGDLLPTFQRGNELAAQLDSLFRETQPTWMETTTQVALTDTIVHLEISASRLAIHPCDQLLVILRDVSERIQSQNRLAEANRQLVDAARRAGKAEVATCVIHNVGNVLTNVNVLAHAVTGNIKNSRMHGFTKASQLLRSRREEQTDSWVGENFGQKLFEYVDELSRCWESESDHLLGDLAALNECLHHANRIVDAQQRFAVTTEMSEPTSLSELIQSSIAITFASFERHQIAVETDLEELPPAMLERDKLLQVLVNLLTNAREAFEGCESNQRTIRVSLCGTPDDRYRIMISDNGSGIHKDVLKQIFQSGFTTKTDGHGFGLHYSALAVQDMGGALSVTSDGPGTGATFCIHLPMRVYSEVASS